LSGLALARPPRLTAVAVVLSALVGLVAALALSSLTAPADDANLAARVAAAAPSSAFTVAVPVGWHALSPAELAATPGRPAAVIRSADHKGVVLIRRAAPVSATTPRLIHDLGTRLRARFPGFRVVSARIARVRGGRAFVYTFTRDPAHTAQTVVLAAAGGKAYEIDAMVPAGAAATARDAGAIVASFGP
jgi:hypothetical protein